jgi:3-oxoacyl-[acyl-carrier protein] reductase
MLNIGTMTSLEGRAAIVTGAGSGIGRGVAQILGAAGAYVICADIVEDSAKATAESICSAGGAGGAAVVDVSRRGEVVDLVASVVAEHGRLDVMCNNAGIIIDVPTLDLTEEELDRVLAINLKGVLFGCQEAGKVMSDQGGGSIINTASGAIDGPTPGLVAYGISKVGIVALTRTLAVELGPQHVRVNAVAPGVIETNITRRHYLNEDGEVDEARREAVLTPMRSRSPLGIIGDPEDVGWAVLYLASDASRFVTGQIIRPNGGTSMPW